MRTILLLLLVFVLSADKSTAQDGSPLNKSLENSPKSQVVRQYLDAFNGGETKMIGFWEKSSISEIQVSQRLERYRGMRSDLGILTLVSTLSETPDDIEVLVQSSKGQKLQMTFLVNKDASPKLTGLHLQPAGEGPSHRPTGTVEAPIGPESENLVLDRIRQLAAAKTTADAFSGAILVARNDEVIWEGAYGMAERNFKIPNQTNTRFDTGSIAKSFTAVAIGQLLEQNKLHLDDVLGKFVPDYQNKIAREKVTVRELLDMTSGVGDIFGPNLDKTPVGNIRSLTDYLPLFETLPLAFEPGSNHSYSNGGYILLGIIIEKVTGQTYYDYVQEHIFRPAEMNNADFPFSDLPHDNEATGYTKMPHDSHSSTSDHDPLRSNIFMMPARGCSAGSARMTVRDLLLYSRALTGEKLLKKVTADSLGISGAAMGILGGGPGINAGIETGIHSAGSSNYTIVVMSNYDPPSAVDLMREIKGMLRHAK